MDGRYEILNGFFASFIQTPGRSRKGAVFTVMSANKTALILVGTGFLVLMLALPGSAGAAAIYSVTDWLIPSFEGFRAHPYWDVSRYSWGYGTAAPGPDGTITKEQALADLRKHAQADYQYLAPMITRPLSANQWGAYLSFSYNEGAGNADNLVANINSGDNAALELQWKKYIYSDGSVNPDLVARRAREWEVWTS